MKYIISRGGNRQLYNFQIDNRLPMGSGTPYENDVFQFQRNIGFPASGNFKFDGLDKDE